ncbi:hypothetical protein GPECTOR_35g904 [Gonium pectorale]|uniref:Uncharacterized protein n=1 Tax=Gonium pectorale TaxID=33097 RepID=A0A150GC89_GONPE|nr:hypothetical protein GPECTOR_35g904 [Gonium pectorale]|eukprot:KXZ47466.1 hypothetical protein GPECTOR_35g904 [Gonium pectorale]
MQEHDQLWHGGGERPRQRSALLPLPAHFGIRQPRDAENVRSGTAVEAEPNLVSSRARALASGDSDVDAGIGTDAAMAARAEAAALSLLEAIERRVELDAAIGSGMDVGLDRDIYDLELQLDLRLAHMDLNPGLAALAPRGRSTGGATGPPAGGALAEQDGMFRATRIAALRALQARLSEVQVGSPSGC